MARSVRRRKYEIASLITLGSALSAQGVHEAATDALGTAIEMADGPGGSPLLRWRARAALGAVAIHRTETAAQAELELRSAASIIRDVASHLAPKRADRYLAAPQVLRVVDAAG